MTDEELDELREMLIIVDDKMTVEDYGHGRVLVRGVGRLPLAEGPFAEIRKLLKHAAAMRLENAHDDQLYRLTAMQPRESAKYVFERQRGDKLVERALELLATRRSAARRSKKAQ